MRFELRLIALAVLLLVLVAAGGRNQAIAARYNGAAIATGVPLPALTEAIHSSTSFSSTVSGIGPLSITTAWKSRASNRVPSAASAFLLSSRILRKPIL